MSASYVRVCPVCEAENPPHRTRCACGGLLTSVDFSLPRKPSGSEQATSGSEQAASASEHATTASEHATTASEHATTASEHATTASEQAPTAVAHAASAANVHEPEASAPAPDAGTTVFAHGAALTCPYPDCAQPNPPGEMRCVYCNRPLAGMPTPVLDTRPLPAALRDDYRIVDVFPATGSEADILLVELRTTHERRVLKLYRRGLRPDFRLLAILADSVGPAVVRVLAHGESDGAAYEVLEYIPGGTLQHYMAAGPVAPTDVRAIVRDVANALTGIHAHRILHRDVKPDNILLRCASPLSLALTDFGIASLSAATQYFTGGARTTRYAAPEVLTGVLDAKADWWSLGMIVLEAATGRHPFDGLTEQVMNLQLATRSIDVSGVYDEDMRRLCRGLLLRDPKRRFGGDEVQRWLDGDATLRAVDDIVETGAATTPYRIDASECANLDELTRALALHWDVGKRDLVRGQVGRWVEGELHDHNLARRLRDIVEQRDASDDRKLAQFLVRAAPDLPPLWRGAPLSEAALEAQARAAVAGDEVAALWLGTLRDDQVLALYPRDTALCAIAAQWQSAWQRFSERWQGAQAAERDWRRTPAGRAGHGESSVDDALYGTQPRLPPPAEYQVNASLLLAIRAPAFVEAMRNEVRAGAAALGGRTPWFDTVWHDHETDPVNVLVAHALLPLARADAERFAERRAAAAAAGEAMIAAASKKVRSRVALVLGMLPDDDAIDQRDSNDVVDAVDPMLAACQEALALDLSAPAHTTLRESLDRLLVRGLALRGALARLQLTEGISAIFRDPQRLGVGVMVAFFVLLSRNVWIMSAVFLGVTGFVLYRWYRRFAAQEAVIKALRNLRLPARMFMREPDK